MPVAKKVQDATQDRLYLLVEENPAQQFFLRSRHKKGAPLTFFDGKAQRAMRYATNQTSVFEDEQLGEVIVEAIVFKNGKLEVPRTNPTLQEFLDKHPSNVANGGNLFKVHNPEKEAEKELENLELEAKAVATALTLRADQIENISLAIWGVEVMSKKTSELKRDVLIYAKENPENFIFLADDDLTELVGWANKAQQLNKVQFEKGNFYAGERMLFKVPFDVEDKTQALAKWFRQEKEGEAFLHWLKKELK